MHAPQTWAPTSHCQDFPSFLNAAAHNGNFPWSQNQCWIQHITALSKKARKKPLCAHLAEIKHGSQATINQCISQHVQESDLKDNTDISKNLGKMFSN